MVGLKMLPSFFHENLVFTLWPFSAASLPGGADGGHHGHPDKIIAFQAKLIGTAGDEHAARRGALDDQGGGSQKTICPDGQFPADGGIKADKASLAKGNQAAERRSRSDPAVILDNRMMANQRIVPQGYIVADPHPGLSADPVENQAVFAHLQPWPVVGA